MPRNSSGVYSLPSVYLAVADTDIVPEQHNTPLEDIAAEITKSVATDGRTPMTGELRLSGDPTVPLGAVPKQYADRPRATTTVALTSSDVTLTDAQCLCGRLLLTGTLLAAVRVSLPTTSTGQWVIDNQTSGSFSVTISSLGGGTTVVPTQGVASQIWHNGTDIKNTAGASTKSPSFTGDGAISGSWTVGTRFLLQRTNDGAEAEAKVYNPGTSVNTSARWTAATGSANADAIWQVTETGSGYADARVSCGAGIHSHIVDLQYTSAEAQWWLGGSLKLRLEASGVLTAVSFAGDGSALVGISRWDLVVEDQKSSGTAGGSASAASWQTRALNTIVKNSVGATLAANIVTLPAGTWELDWDAPSYATNGHATRLYNVTASTVIEYGAPEGGYLSSAPQSRSWGRCEVAFATSTQIRVDHYTTSSQAGTGLGVAASIPSVPERYARIRAKKIS